MNTLRVRLQKLLATCVSALIPVREARHRVRYCLHPLNDRRCVRQSRNRYRRVYHGFGDALRAQARAVGGG